MIKVTKNFNDIPNSLKKANRKEAFEKNIQANKFLYGKSLYKPEEVKNRLSKIYYNKCAYCEKDISDDPKHIEHYRPKNIYYWLSYSWDNLLFCCSRCNSAKREKFETNNTKVRYKNEKYEDIHTLSSNYDEIEEPMFINPEKDDILKDIMFHANGTIYSKNRRVQYTIKNCNLNRDALVQHRVKIINDLKNNIKLYYKDKSILKNCLKNFISNSKVESEYYSFRKYIAKNIALFFQNS